MSILEYLMRKFTFCPIPLTGAEFDVLTCLIWDFPQEHSAICGMLAEEIEKERREGKNPRIYMKDPRAYSMGPV